MTIYTSAPSNIALVKYWGKRNTKHNLPLTSSFSVTLEKMRTWVAISPLDQGEDQWKLYGNPKKHSASWPEARAATGNQQPLSITIQNDFLQAQDSQARLLRWRRWLSPSISPSLTAPPHATKSHAGPDWVAVRRFASLYPGYVLWEAGIEPEGKDCVAQSKFTATHMPLALIACVIDDRTKPISSTEAMERCRDTSPTTRLFTHAMVKTFNAQWMLSQPMTSALLAMSAKKTVSLCTMSCIKPNHP
ncbi:MAG: hypothetical protein H6728_15620 [Myxococcales bacterium]|nr:hypothetical protein [Myxococcales bacterium]